jgi:hypothetical protein
MDQIRQHEIQHVTSRVPDMPRELLDNNSRSSLAMVSSPLECDGFASCG